MKHAYIFPGQGAQFSGMGKDLYENVPQAKEMFEKANEILGFRITDIMFEGSADELKQTKVTQPAVFLQISAGAGRQRIDAARACLHVALQRVRIEEDSGQPVFAVLDLLAAAQEERIVLVRAVGQRVAAARHECAAIAGIILRSEHIPGLRAKPALLLGLFDGFFFVGKFLMKQCA